LRVSLSWLLVIIFGAIFGAARRRHANGVIPGALLAIALIAALGCPPGCGEKLDLLQGLRIVGGSSASALLVGGKKLNFLDIPLDFRIVVAVSIGFFLRGAVQTVNGLIR
jgi:hypothetical protein